MKVSSTTSTILLAVILSLFAESILGENAVLVFYNKEGTAPVNSTCSDYEHSELRYAMYRSVGYEYDRRRLSNICSDWCEAYNPGNCQVIHPECVHANSTATMVGYVGDETACGELVLDVDQALDLLSSAMSSECEALINTRSYQCIVQK